MKYRTGTLGERKSPKLAIDYRASKGRPSTGDEGCNLTTNMWLDYLCRITSQRRKYRYGGNKKKRMRDEYE